MVKGAVFPTEEAGRDFCTLLLLWLTVFHQFCNPRNEQSQAWKWLLGEGEIGKIMSIKTLHWQISGSIPSSLHLRCIFCFFAFAQVELIYLWSFAGKRILHLSRKLRKMLVLYGKKQYLVKNTLRTVFGIIHERFIYLGNVYALPPMSYLSQFTGENNTIVA